MEEIPSIRSWNELLPLQTRSLVVLDIDETFLWFPTINDVWWKTMLKGFIAKHGHEMAQRLAREEWKRVISNELPMQTDTEGFQALNSSIKRTNSILIFLTARLESFAPLTRKHLTDCGVSADVEVHYSTSKGETLRQIRSRHPECSDVIFVDDKRTNLNDVVEHNPKVKVYQWVHET